METNLTYMINLGDIMDLHDQHIFELVCHEYIVTLLDIGKKHCSPEIV